VGVDDKLIISIQDFRRLTGDETAHFTDKQCEEAIQQLDIIAEMYVKQAIAGEEAADTLKDEQ
jgi:hypothetical protein